MISSQVLYLAWRQLLLVPINKPVASFAVLSHKEKARSDLTQLGDQLVFKVHFVGLPDLVGPALWSNFKSAEEKTAEGSQGDLMCYLVDVDVVDLTGERDFDLIDDVVSRRNGPLLEAKDFNSAI